MALADTADAPLRRPGSTKLDWPHALRALRRLLNDKEDTGQVFEIMRALNGASTAKGYHRLLAPRRAAASPTSARSWPGG